MASLEWVDSVKPITNVEIYESPDVRLPDTVEEVPYNDEVQEKLDLPSGVIGSNNDVDRHLRLILNKLDEEYHVTNEEHQLNSISRGEITETTHQKLVRLKHEADALQSLLCQSPDRDVSLLDALSGVQQKLTKLDKAWGGISNNQPTKVGTKLLAKLEHARALLETVDHPEVVARVPELVYKKEVSHAFELETRIKSLEQLLGSAMSRPVEVSEFTNLGGNLARMHALLRILADPSQLDHVLHKIKLINAELEQLCEVHEGLASEGQLLYYDEEPELSKQVDQLMELFDRLDPLVQQAPMLTSRLKTLGGFHNEALDMVLILGKLEGLVRSAEEDASSALDRCQRANDSLRANLDSIRQNTQHVEARLTSIAARLEKLQAQA